MWNIQHRRNNLCVTILTCICLGNLLLYIAFTNLHAEFVRRNGIPRITALHNSTHHKNQDDGELYKYVINQPLLCNDNVKLIIVICSSLDHFRQRQAIRETWGNVISYRNVKVIFLVGRYSEKHFSKINTKFWNENRKFRDVVQADFIDSYRNLTLKSIVMLHWVKTFCNNVKYLMKTDDDMYINIPNLFRALDKQVVTKFMMGNLIIGAKPVQDQSSKWYTPKKTFPSEYYPPYLSGTAYVISGSVIPNLFNATKHSKFFWLEDIFITGICAKTAGIYHIHRNDMTFNLPISYDCKIKSVISLHNIKRENMRLVHRIVNDNTTGFCDKSK